MRSAALKTRRQPWRFRLLLATWCLIPLTAAAQSLRCEAGIVQTGADAAAVRERCGEPDHVESWQAAPPASPGAVWFYNEGPSRLLRLLRFRDGRLVDIGNDGYGFLPPARPGCRPGEPQPGWSAYRLLALCGPPAARETVGRLLLPPARADGSGAGGGLRPVFRQRWRYDFGPRSLQREYTLDDASISHVRTLDRGGS